MGGKKEGKNNSFEPKTYVITAAQGIQSEKNAEKYGSDSHKGSPHKNFIRGLETYCKEKGGELNILSMAGMNETEKDLHSFFQNYNVLYSLVEKKKNLNTNVGISDMVEPPQNMNIPTTRDRFVRDKSAIMAHTKQTFRCIPISNCDFPRIIAGTGACTHPNYNIDRKSASGNRRADFALRDHEYGAVVVEIIDDIYYNVRHLTAQKDGKFIDLGLKYDGDKSPKKIKTEAIVLGDLHVGETDPRTMEANYEMIKHFNPKRIFIHDLFNGASINPHEKNDRISKAQRKRLGNFLIEKELKQCYDILKDISKVAGQRCEINVVASNHDNFLYRYLSQDNFLEDTDNCDLACELFRIAIKEDTPVEAANRVVEYGIKKMGKIPSNIQFLGMGDDYRVWGYQLASHGHLGYSGGRGSVNAQELNHGKSITAHTHSPQKLRNTYIVGTSTSLDLAYTIGQGSKWLAANAPLYEGGTVQLLPIINGKWRKK